LAKIKSVVDGGKTNAVSQLPALLKSVALQAYPRGEVAQLSGQLWLDFLDSKLVDKKFNAANALLMVAYSPMDSWQLSAEDVQTLFLSCENWISSHAVSEAKL
jgi:hypothetical protein